eukprot:scaffold25466_cov95-Isochrysis_galbana.AAC.2
MGERATLRLFVERVPLGGRQDARRWVRDTTGIARHGRRRTLGRAGSGHRRADIRQRGLPLYRRSPSHGPPEAEAPERRPRSPLGAAAAAAARFPRLPSRLGGRRGRLRGLERRRRLTWRCSSVHTPDLCWFTPHLEKGSGRPAAG